MTDQVDLSPAAKIALTVAAAQLRRGENPPINVTAALVLELEALSGPQDLAPGESEAIIDPRRVRAELEAIDAALLRMERAGFTRRVPTGVGVAMAPVRGAVEDALSALREGAPEAFDA